jgi:23S rRNA pseudouridine1911/1915/1917 synthase
MPTLFEWLVQKYPTAKKQTLREMVKERRVTINGKPARSVKEAVGESDRVAVGRTVQRPRASIEPLRIVHEDEDVLVVNKPPGLLTSTTVRERRATAIALVRDYLADREPRARAGIVHRLDRDASGLLVFSKNNAAHQSLKRQFFQHTVLREYLAVVHGMVSPPTGKIESQLVELKDGSVRDTHAPGKGQKAVTEYEVVSQGPKLAVVRVRLETGRKHQIRAHFAQRKNPVVGDEMYEGPQEPGTRLLLAAVKLGFDHPGSGERVTFEIAPPVEIGRAIEQTSGPDEKAKSEDRGSKID